MICNYPKRLSFNFRAGATYKEFEKSLKNHQKLNKQQETVLKIFKLVEGLFDEKKDNVSSHKSVTHSNKKHKGTHHENPTKTPATGSVERIVTVSDIEDPSFMCVPGEPFMLECNRCWCAKNGKEPRTCTRIACNPKIYKPLGSAPPLSEIL